MTMFCASVLCGALSSALVTWVLSEVNLKPFETRGPKGRVRRQARQNILFRGLDFLVRFADGHLGVLWSAATQEKLDVELARAGEFGGFRSSEFLSMQVVAFIVGLSCAGLLWETSQLAGVICLLLGVVGCRWQLASRTKERARRLESQLPGLIDVAALGMGAGQGFLAALETALCHLGGQHDEVREEFDRVLLELSLGHSRKNALGRMRRETASASLREFAVSVVQAEEQGTPLAEVMRQQARTLRQRRGVRAEEAAARAGVLLMTPMMMMVVSIMLIVMGPLLIDLKQGGF